MRQREPWVQKLGKTIRRYRMKRGLTLQQAADAFGCTLHRWQHFEAGEPLKIRTLLKIAAVVRASGWRLLKG